MALNKTPVPISFTQGIETKTDPYQVQVGKFLNLTNSVFTTTGRLTKRNGFDNITSLPNAEQTTLTTHAGSLIATGADLYSFSENTSQWIDQGTIQPVQLEVQSIVRNSSSQSRPDMAIAPDGLACVAYRDSDGTSYYHVIDSATGQQIVERTALPTGSQSPKVSILGKYFIVTFIVLVTGTPTLQFVAVQMANPAMASSPTNISADVNSIDSAYDTYSINNSLYVGWGASANSTKMVFITRALGVSSPVTLAGITATALSLTAGNSRVYISWYNSSSQTGFMAAYTFNLIPAMTATSIITATPVRELSSIRTNGTVKVYYQVANTYTYSDAITDYISTVSVTPPATVTTGAVSAPSVVLRSVGLISKPFIGADGVTYMVVAYGDMNQTPSSNNSNQPTYFLIDSLGNIYMRLAYSNGGGYAQGSTLCNVTQIEDAYYFPYQITDFLTTVNKGTDLPAGQPTNAIYTQTGINLAKIQLNVQQQYSSEIAGSLHLTGGQLWQFDGVKPVEHNFHVWPENIVATGDGEDGGMTEQKYFYRFTYEWTDNQGQLHRSAPSIPLEFEILNAPASFTADTDNTMDVLTNVSAFTNLQVGQELSGTGIQAGTKIIALDPDNNEITMSLPATADGVGITISVTSATSAIINVPTLRLTYKVSPNPVRIVGYRWSAAQQTYYQFTSVTQPVLNNTAVDSVAIEDDHSDAAILGQTLLYTTGGVLENIAAPASVHSTLFNNRVWLIDAEDPDTLWFSKQIIQNTPVEFSDLLTRYVAPTTGAQASTGPSRCIAAMDDKLIIFKDNAIYYMNGSGPDITGANSSYSDPIYITGVAGCANPNSLVLIPQGLMFQSNKGIWMLGRDLNTKYIGADAAQYQNDPIRSSSVIPNTNEVRFILASGKTLMYDYFVDQWSTHTNINAISATIYDDLHTYLNNQGLVYQQNPESYKDGSIPVLMSFTTSWINIAGVQGYERFYFANLLGTYYSPFKLSVQFAYDYNPSPQTAITVIPDNQTPYWGDEAVWGSGGPWGGIGDVFSARIFPEKQKCESFQVTINEQYDPSYGIEPGQGLSLSGLNLIVGVKRGFRTQSAKRSFG